MIRGDLDWIVMKALEKDRNRRYDTANGFAADIERYLNDEAVVARPPSAGYRLRKLARRNKAVFTTVTIVAAALLLGTMVSTSQWIRAIQNEQQAIRNQQLAQNREEQLREAEHFGIYRHERSYGRCRKSKSKWVSSPPMESCWLQVLGTVWSASGASLNCPPMEPPGGIADTAGSEPHSCPNVQCLGLLSRFRETRDRHDGAGCECVCARGGTDLGHRFAWWPATGHV
jgi:hypothetical protein